ncbi:MAG TPA: hypothetical protein VH396_16010 [Chitinophagaceae bacterium]
MTHITVPLFQYKKDKIKRSWNINEFVKKFKLSFSKHDVLGSKFIGLDKLKRKLFYIGQTNNKSTCIAINLKDVERCTIKKQYNNIEAGALKKRKLYEFLTTIFLQVSFKHNSKLIDLPIFEKKKDKILNMEELEAKVKAWEIIVSELLPINLKKRA